jgi:hypothetical protein
VQQNPEQSLSDASDYDIVDIDDAMDAAMNALLGDIPLSDVFSSRLVFWQEMTVKAGNVIAWNSNASHPFNGVFRQVPAAINDELEIFLAVPAGTYRMDLYGFKSSICGQQQWKWNGNSFAAVVDWYNATTVVSQLVQPGYDMVVTGNEGLTLNSKVTAKNASATDYQVMLTWMKIRRTGE